MIDSDLMLVMQNLIDNSSSNINNVDLIRENVLRIYSNLFGTNYN